MKLHALAITLLLGAPAICANDTVDQISKLSQTIEESIFPPTSPLQLTPQEIGVVTNALLLLFLDAHDTLRSLTNPLTQDEQRKQHIIQQTLATSLEYIEQSENQKLQAVLTIVKRNAQSIIKTYLKKHQESLLADMRQSHELMNSGSQLLARVAQVYEEQLDNCVRADSQSTDMIAFFDAIYSTNELLQDLTDQLNYGSEQVKVVTRKLQQMSLNIFGLWYKVLYESMQKNGFDAPCFSIAFTQNQLIPESLRTTLLPSPASLMLEITT